MSNDGFTFQGTGKLKRVDTFITKAGKEVLTLVFETGGQYPQLIPIKVFGRLVEDAKALRPGAIVEVQGRLGGRDWQCKVFGDITATRIEQVAEGNAEAEAKQETFADQDVPF